MNRRNRFATAVFASLIVAAGSLAVAQAQKDKQPQLPPGWTEADMQACAAAGTPGPQHKFLTDAAGVWQGKSTMWMSPGAEPIRSECTSTITSVMDGRFTKCELSGDVPGMGPMSGFGLFGYDNVAQQFQSTWICSCGTGMMQGAGELSSDGTTLTWQYRHTCPITKKPTTIREIERRSGKDNFTLETFGIDPKTGKEFKMMEVAFTRKSDGTAVTSAR
jgi:hypothetical protein